MGADEEVERQARLILDAIERAGRPRKVIADDMGIAPSTLDGWILAGRRLCITQLGLLVRALGDPWIVNEILRPTGFVAVRIPTGDGAADLTDRLQAALNRLAAATGMAAGKVADATDSSSADGSRITAGEAHEIDSALDEVRAIATAIKDRLHEEMVHSN